MCSTAVRATVVAAGIAVLMGGTIAAAEDYQGTGDDYAQISNILRVYSWGLDYHDGPMWASAFTPNGEFHDQQYCLIGRAQIAPVAAGRNPSATPKLPTSHHIVEMGPLTFQDRNHATMKNYVMVVGDVSRDRSINGGIRITGLYEDTLERLNGKWLIAKRMEYSPGDKPPAPCPGK
jgi:SnoaL-like protein